MPEYQRALRICENRKLKKEKLKKLGGFLSRPKTLEAWYCLREFLQPIKGMRGNFWLPVDERSAIPVSPYDYPLDKKELFNQDKVAEAALNFTSMESDIQHRKSRYYDFMAIAVMGIVIVFIIVIMLYVSGHVNIADVFKAFNPSGAK